ncbi:carbonic anhydrase [Marinicella pacifica]|nr:carbonic anhydrase [Marinicella pacifica]
MKRAQQALAALKAGNQRFIDEHQSPSGAISGEKRMELTQGQKPFAVILGCSDSRAPAELVFDQGLGDLFVIRVAGNIVAPSLIGSIEFSVAEFDTPLVVVMGHTECGAVTATLNDIKEPGVGVSHHIQSIVRRIKPAVTPLTDLVGVDNVTVSQAVKANVQKSVDQLLASSDLLEDALGSGKLNIVGACYNISTGVVEFYDD